MSEKNHDIMQAVFEAIPDLLSVVDRDMRIVFSNWHGGYEYVPQEMRSGNPHCFDAYYPGQGGPCKPCHLQEVFTTGKPVIREKHNPGIGDLEVHAFPVFDANGNIVMAAEYLRDITSRRRAENALRQANHVLEAIINTSPLAIVALDRELNLTLWNDSAEKMFWWEKDEVLFKPYPIIPEERWEEVMENIRQLERGEVRRCVETCRKRRDGSLVDVSLSTAALRDQENEIIGYMAIMADISEYRLNQRALRESEANYRAIFDAANDAIFVLDVETGSILDVNRKLCEMCGYTREEVLLLKIEDLSSGKKPYTQENAVKQIRKAKDKKSHLFEWMARDSAGRLFWVEVNMKGAVIGGDFRALAVVRDITERKQSLEALRESEKRFRQIFEENEDPAFILAPRTFSIVDANSSAAHLYGYSKKEMKRKSPSLFIAPEEYDKFEQILASLETATNSRNRSFRLDRLMVFGRNGKSIMTSVRGKIIRSRGKDFIYCTFRDITEKLKIREERKKLEEKLIQANKMTALGTLASGIAHEVNNPNNYILSNTQFLHGTWKDIEPVLSEYFRENGEYSIGGLPCTEAVEVIPKLLASLEEGSIRIKNIVENLKSFARQEKSPYFTPFDVNMAVKASINILGNQIRKYTDNFFCNLAENLPKVMGSFQQMEQVIINLTINALQALPNKNCGIYLSTFHDRSLHQVVIRVRDQGVGIPPKVLHRIMEPFFTTKQDSGGTGLGLSICYSIIKEHQGSIEFESDLSLGTTVTVRLPVYGVHL